MYHVKSKQFRRDNSIAKVLPQKGLQETKNIKETEDLKKGINNKLYSLFSWWLLNPFQNIEKW